MHTLIHKRVIHSLYTVYTQATYTQYIHSVIHYTQCAEECIIVPLLSSVYTEAEPCRTQSQTPCRTPQNRLQRPQNRCRMVAEPGKCTERVHNNLNVLHVLLELYTVKIFLDRGAERYSSNTFTTLTPYNTYSVHFCSNRVSLCGKV